MKFDVPQLKMAVLLIFLPFLGATAQTDTLLTDNTFTGLKFP
jgi:hypothetical protein